MKRSVLIVAVVGCAACAHACSDPREAQPLPPPSAPAPPPVPAEELANAKIGDLILRCINVFNDDPLEGYSAWTSPDGPTGREHGSPFFREMSPERCREAVDALPGRPPALPELESSAARFATALEAVSNVMTEARTYYARGTFRDDAFAGARELHPRLIAAGAEFRDARAALRSQIDAIQERANEARLARFAGDPARRTQYLAERTMNEAEAVLTAFQRVEQDADGRLSTPEGAETFATLVSTFQTHVDEMRAHRPVPPDQGYRSEGAFGSSAERFLEIALDLMRTIRDRVALNDIRTRYFNVEVPRRYDALVDAFNLIAWP